MSTVNVRLLLITALWCVCCWFRPVLAQQNLIPPPVEREREESAVVTKGGGVSEMGAHSAERVGESLSRQGEALNRAERAAMRYESPAGAMVNGNFSAGGISQSAAGGVVSKLGTGLAVTSYGFSLNEIYRQSDRAASFYYRDDNVEAGDREMSGVVAKSVCLIPAMAVPCVVSEVQSWYTGIDPVKEGIAGGTNAWLHDTRNGCTVMVDSYSGMPMNELSDECLKNRAADARRSEARLQAERQRMAETADDNAKLRYQIDQDAQHARAAEISSVPIQAPMQPAASWLGALNGGVVQAPQSRSNTSPTLGGASSYAPSSTRATATPAVVTPAKPSASPGATYRPRPCPSGHQCGVP